MIHVDRDVFFGKHASPACALVFKEVTKVQSKPEIRLAAAGVILAKAIELTDLTRPAVLEACGRMLRAAKEDDTGGYEEALHNYMAKEVLDESGWK